jgi:excinuclease UvrABC ATPase subunit
VLDEPSIGLHQRHTGKLLAPVLAKADTGRKKRGTSEAAE